MSPAYRENLLFVAIMLSCLAAALLLRTIFSEPLPPGLADPFVIGIMILGYKTSPRRVMLFLAVSLAFSAWLLYPLDFRETYQMLSYAALALVVIGITQALRRSASRQPW